MSFARVPFDPELERVLRGIPKGMPTTKDGILQRRKAMEPMTTIEVLNDPFIVHESKTVSGPNGDIELAILRLKDGCSGPRPAIFYIHGGAMLFGSRFYLIDQTFEWIKQLDIVVISVEYRLAPEHPDPAPIDDCYAGFKWVGQHSSELGVDPDKTMVCGHSSGGGLAAGLSLLVRDRGGPKIFAQCLIYPMIDDRMITVSSQQYMTEGLFTGEGNTSAWNWLLDGKRGTEDVTIYAAPARASNLSNLPPTWIDVGAAEPFRDEAVAYATKLWEAGIQTELHVWEGAFHGFDVLAPKSKLGKVCIETRLAWFRRLFAGTETPLTSKNNVATP